MLIKRDEVKVLLPSCVDIFLSLLLVFDPVDNTLHITVRTVYIILLPSQNFGGGGGGGGQGGQFAPPSPENDFAPPPPPPPEVGLDQ